MRRHVVLAGSGADVSTKRDVRLFVEMPQFQHERPPTKPWGRGDRASIALPAREAPPGKDVDDARGSFLVDSLTVRLREG